MTAITVTIPGNPIPYERTGGTSGGRRVHTPKTRDYLERIGAFAMQATQRSKMTGITWPTEARYSVLVLVVRERLDGDVDNIAKAALDGCSAQWAGPGALWKHDTRVDDLRVVRCAPDRENPRLVIMASTIDHKPRSIDDLDWLAPSAPSVERARRVFEAAEAMLAELDRRGIDYQESRALRRALDGRTR